MRTAGRCEEKNDKAIWKGAIAGLAGGLVGSWSMNQFQAGVSRLSRATSEGGAGSSPSPPQEDDATVRAASAILESAVDRELTQDEKKIAGPVIHYAFGSTMGALYGAAAEIAPAAGKVWGLPFGAVLWLGADEIGVTAAGLSRPPGEVPASTHASALAAHLVYGATADAVRRLVRSTM